jgi:hypothetical protein
MVTPICEDREVLETAAVRRRRDPDMLDGVAMDHDLLRRALQHVVLVAPQQLRDGLERTGQVDVV